MPRERPQPPPFETEALERSLNRYLAWGIVFMVLLLAGFVAYGVREPGLRRDAKRGADHELHGDREPDLRDELRAMSREGRDRRRQRPDAQLHPVLEEHDRRPDLRARVGRGLRNRDAGVEPRLWRDAHGRAGTPGRHLHPLARTERAQHPRVAPGCEGKAVALPAHPGRNTVPPAPRYAKMTA